MMKSTSTDKDKAIRKDRWFNPVKFLSLMGIALVMFIGLFLYYVNNTSGIIWMVALGSIFSISLGIPIGAFFGSDILKAKALRLIMGRNIGIVTIINGNLQKKVLANFDKDFLNINDNAYVIDKGRIFYGDSPNSKSSTPIDSNSMKFTSGVPHLYLDMETITPVSFVKDKISLSPRTISATIKAHLANRETELMNKQSQGFKIKIWGVLILAAIALGLSWSVKKQITEEVMPMLQTIKTLVETSGAVKVPAVANVVTQGA